MAVEICRIFCKDIAYDEIIIIRGCHKYDNAAMPGAASHLIVESGPLHMTLHMSYVKSMPLGMATEYSRANNPAWA
jgi:hypothetical protein